MRTRLRLLAILLTPLLAQCVGGGGIFPGAGAGGKVTTTTRDAARAAQLITQYRRSRGLGAVVVDNQLNEPAVVQARAVAETGTLSHGDFASRMAQFGIRGHSAENLSAGTTDVAAAVAQWQGSSGHDRNLLLPNARRIGLARADSPGRGYGTYWALVLSN